jgi:predicted TIM-barrel fold metal-dependent hydrolase
MVSRRRLLKAFAAFLAARSLPEQTAAAAAKKKLIDVHCHLFNATDLPARRFIKIVVLEHYPPQGVEHILDLQREDLLDRFIDFWLGVAGASRAPTARDELDALDGVAPVKPEWADVRVAGDLVIQRTADYLQQPSPITPERKGPPAASNQIKMAILRAGKAAGQAPKAIKGDKALSIAREAYNSNTDLGAYLQWFTLFTMYRHALLNLLTEVHESQGFSPVMVAPAMIDFSQWLGQPVASPLDDQVMVMARIARRKQPPAVHCYVAFDPLREVYYRRGLLRRSSLGIVRDALTKHGFLGVKLYPPMGFKPFENGHGRDPQTYPQEIIDELGGNISSDLNRTLNDLFKLCLQHDAPILAHANESNGSGPDYARRADPAYWLPVFQKFPKLRVCLAHFGRFNHVSEAKPSGSKLPESSWEWAIGRHMLAHPDAMTFVDLSYLSEILDKDDRARIGRVFRNFIARFDPDAQRIMFATDWIMLGKEPRGSSFTGVMASFLSADCGLNPDQIERVFIGNAVRFLGLRVNDPTRERLLEFYRDNSMDGGLLPEY